MKKEIMEKIYRDPKVLDYLRHHPKWYYYIDLDSNNYNELMKVIKKEFKETPYDKLEKFKTQVSFVSSIVNYFKN